MTMPAGEYYIGDLCYVIEEWDEYCGIVIKGSEVLDGEFQMPDGRKFASYSTAYGDGVYEDENGNEYPVDAGLIGCILASDISKGDYDTVIKRGLGCFHTFETPFETGSNDGVIVFGRVKIDTHPEYDEEYDEEYDWG